MENIKNAINNLTRMRDEVGPRLMGYDYEGQGEADKRDFDKDMNLAISALEKQMEKKITHEESLPETCTCPNCHNALDKFENFCGQKVRVTFYYCHFCGQRLDWSEVK